MVQAAVRSPPLASVADTKLNQRQAVAAPHTPRHPRAICLLPSARLPACLLPACLSDCLSASSPACLTPWRPDSLPAFLFARVPVCLPLASLPGALAVRFRACRFAFLLSALSSISPLILEDFLLLVLLVLLRILACSCLLFLPSLAPKLNFFFLLWNVIIY